MQFEKVIKKADNNRLDLFIGIGRFFWFEPSGVIY